MSTTLHIIDVGQGNMNLAICDNGAVILYDCNITDENRNTVFAYLKKTMPKPHIDVFVNSHRDCDHMRNVREVHSKYPIKAIWDSGQYGTSPQDPVYKSYMSLRRELNCVTPKMGQSWNAGNTKILCLNGWRDKTDDANTQSIVLKIDHKGSSIVLTGDSDAVAWKKRILPNFKMEQIKSSLLMASHHGSLTFFDDPGDEKNYYTKHVNAINPAMTIISVGKNVHGHPDAKAIEFYEKYSSGSDKGNKVFRTDKNGHIKVELKGSGSWSLTPNQ
jgi:competence protein ComEC